MWNGEFCEYSNMGLHNLVLLAQRQFQFGIAVNGSLSVNNSGKEVFINNASAARFLLQKNNRERWKQ